MTSNAIENILDENTWLRLRLEEAEAVVDAIRNGIVDAVVVSAPGESVYLLEGADRPYRLLVEAMQQPVAVLNLEGVVLYGNPCFANLFAMPLDTIIGRTLESFVADVDHSLWADILNMSGGISPENDIWMRRQNGVSFPASIALSTLPLGRICLLVTDLSQKKLLEEMVVSKAALRISEIRYRRLFEMAKDGILILDTDSGRITDANPFMCDLLGYSQEEFLGKELWEIGLFSDKTANEAAVRELRSQGYIRYEHLPLETSSGRKVDVEVVANSYREDEHRVIQCNIRDITDRTRLAEERDRLEALMLEQSTGLQDLHHRKDEFLAMLGHELRNPLAAISNGVQLLRFQKNEGPTQQKARTIIERQVAQLTRLVDDLLEVARITTGRIHLQEELVAMNGIAKNGIETAYTLISERRHVLKVLIPEEPIWLFADASRLEQVVVNLLTNAAKYTHDGGQISLIVEQKGSDCLLTVRDSGVGIAADLLPHIFDLFAQAERSLDRAQGGLGIGLALVQRLVEMHHGTVTVSSTLGIGSDFIVRLPVVADPETKLASTFAEIANPVGPTLRVLIVDDNVDATEMLQMLLMQTGYGVRTAHDGPSSLKTALDYHPDVILLDIGLPGMDGFEVARSIRQQPTFKNVVLIAMTGYGQESDRMQSRDAGFDHHMVKPTDFNKLQKILATVPMNAT